MRNCTVAHSLGCFVMLAGLQYGCVTVVTDGLLMLSATMPQQAAWHLVFWSLQMHSMLWI
jgi:hypothetical protein